MSIPTEARDCGDKYPLLRKNCADWDMPHVDQHQHIVQSGHILHKVLQKISKINSAVFI